ncbi:hypothetical protein GGQ71_003522 [Rhizobium taibaishanense]|uniref:Uncharacterized protein n=1 Tax=Allorhizobium taibaishanense TaxID=887144 RepID=A0A7W6MVD3_9HYPH|nr:hypothetical protein [Allorhizobium taibaishanense]
MIVLAIGAALIAASTIAVVSLNERLKPTITAMPTF